MAASHLSRAARRPMPIFTRSNLHEHSCIYHRFIEANLTAG